ncbi:MAG TPA: histidine phosphatase family protein [Meiothermus sp.]|nr:histidine phosphatase family protein [Meiothermus sp.]
MVCKLWLVKHAQPEIVAEVPAKDWKLSAEGSRQSECLAERLRDAGLEQVITSLEPKAHSLEPKAHQTGRILAERLSIPFSSAPDLHEHRRESTEFIGEHARWEEMVREFFASPDQLIFGEETADEAHRRFSRAVRR